MGQASKQKTNSIWSMAVGAGVAIGAEVGVAIDNIALGAGIGVAIGAAIAGGLSAAQQKQIQDSTDEDPN